MQGGLSTRQRIDLERFLLKQASMRGSRNQASRKYLEKFPGDAGKHGVTVGDIVKKKPLFVWYSRHALFREGPDSLTRNEINNVILKGEYVPNRTEPYYNTKYNKWATNRGTIAPTNNANTCPTRRIKNFKSKRTVVLSFCYPRAFSIGSYRPEVVTAYRY